MTCFTSDSREKFPQRFRKIKVRLYKGLSSDEAKALGYRLNEQRTEEMSDLDKVLIIRQLYNSTLKNYNDVYRMLHIPIIDPKVCFELYLIFY